MLFPGPEINNITTNLHNNWRNVGSSRLSRKQIPPKRGGSSVTFGVYLHECFTVYAFGKYFKPTPRTVPRRCFFCVSFLLFLFRVCRAIYSVHCSLMVTCWERTDLLALLYAMFSCVLSLSHVVSWVRCGF